MKENLESKAIEKFMSYPKEERVELGYIDGYTDGATIQHNEDLKNASAFVCSECSRHASCKIHKEDCKKLKDLRSYIGAEYEI